MKQKCRQVLIVISVLLLGAEATCSQNRGIKKPFNEYSFDFSRDNGEKMPSSIMDPAWEDRKDVIHGIFFSSANNNATIDY